MENQINISVTQEQVNLILGCLAKAPYEVSATLIQTIVYQVQPQISSTKQSDPQGKESSEPAQETLQ